MKKRGSNYQQQIKALERQLAREQAEAQKNAAVADLQRLQAKGLDARDARVVSAQIKILRATQQIARLDATDKARAAARRSKAKSQTGDLGLGIDLGFIKL